MNSILFSFREFHNLHQEEIAKNISMSIEDYKNLELGVNEIDTETASKLSRFFNVPSNVFLLARSDTHFSIIYSQCHFENSNGYVNHLYNENELVLQAKDDVITMLKKEVSQLRQKNTTLLNKLLDS